MRDVTAGTRLNGRYVLLEPIGSGGMSRVWRARDELLDRAVAVKFLGGAPAADPPAAEDARREVRAAARLTHPNVAHVYDYGRAHRPGAPPVPYLVMELVEGENLARRLAAGPLPWPEAVRVGAQVAAALCAAHRAGLVHLDVKPGNVMLTADGAKVLDFGIAALAGAVTDGRFSGTPTYTAPERLHGSPAHPANDVYSLGVLLYELLAGVPPARMDDWEQAAAAHRSGRLPRVPPVPGLPAVVGDLVAACLSPDPGRRPSAERLAAELAAALDRRPTFPATAIPTAALPAATVPAGAPAAATVPAGPLPAAVPTRYAVGSARLPPPPTRVDHAAPPAATGAGRGRLLVAGVGAAAVVLALLAVVVASALPDPADTGPVVAPTAPAATAPPAATPRPVAPPAPPPRPRDRALEDLRNLLDGRLPGAVSPDAAEDLRDRLADVVEELAERKESPQRAAHVRDRLDDLLEEIDQLEDDGELPPGWADRLRASVREAMAQVAG
ncbi:MAG: protein kinase [Micromonosporaceae bacterium]